MILLLLLAGAAQQPAPPTAANQSPRADDIVVTGARDLTDLDDPASPVRSGTLGSSKTGPGAAVSRTAFEVSQRYARCAVERSPKSLAMLRETLDGTINSARQGASQERLARMHRTCLLDPRSSGTVGLANYDGAYYDRGAMTIAALRAFAPDLRLTREQTADRAVQRRFDAREVPLARFRLPFDRRFFEIAVCLVRLQPELSVRLAATDGPVGAVNRLEAAIVNRGKVCVGNAKNVYFDATQFRFYIADAVYRWAVAARGVETLIPER